GRERRARRKSAWLGLCRRRCGLVALEEGKRVALRVLADREVPDRRNRRLGHDDLAAERLDAAGRLLDVFRVEIDRKAALAALRGVEAAAGLGAADHVV